MTSIERWWRRPAPALADLIDRYWGWDGYVDVPPLILPGTGAECLFHYDEAFALDDGSRPAGLLCPRTRSVRLQAQQKIGFVAVRFRSGRLRYFCNRPFADLHDQFWSSEALWGGEALRLSEALRENRDRSAQVAALDTFFLARLVQYGPCLDSQFDLLLDWLYYAPATPIETLAARSGWSRRHLARKFLDLYGCTPKRFACQSRFSHAMRLLALHPDTSLSQAALQTGYFDQAHFIHETRSLTGHCPQEIIQAMQSGSHFYNPPSRVPLYDAGS